MKTLLISHAHCLDGLATMAVMKYAYPEADMLYCSYDSLPSVSYLKEYENIIVGDFSLPVSLLAQISDIFVTIIDHHVSAEPALREHTRITRNFIYHYDATECGATLAWNVLVGKKDQRLKLPPILQFVRDNDLYKFEFSGTKDIVAGLWFYDQEARFEIFSTVTKLHALENTNQLDRSTTPPAHMRRSALEEIGRVVNKYRQTHISKYLEIDHFHYCEKHNVYVGDVPRLFASEVGNKVALTTNRMVLLYTIRGRQVRCSARGVHEMDTIPLSSQFGGGGHRKASGFTMALPDFVSEFLS